MQHFSEKLKSDKAFTLIEIMVVVAIIGILASIAVINVLSVKLNANHGRIESDLNTFRAAVENYRANQNPPSFPISSGNGILELTNTTPAYLDETWSTGNASTVERSSYIFTYTSNTTNYTLQAAPAPYAISGKNYYCLDTSGNTRIDNENAITLSNNACSSGELLSR